MSSDQSKILVRMMKCVNEEDLIPALHDLLQYKEESERIMMILKANHRLPKKCSLHELEMHML